MKNLVSPLVSTALFATFSITYAQHSSAEVKTDIQRHRAMASAHDAAAKCLDAGKKPVLCEAELQKACKGLAIGKYCGMKHAH